MFAIRDLDSEFLLVIYPQWIYIQNILKIFQNQQYEASVVYKMVKLSM